MRKNYFDPDGFWYYCSNNWFKKFLFNSILDPRFSRYDVNYFQDYFIRKYLSSLFDNPSHSGPWLTLDDRGKYMENTNFDSEMATGFKLSYGALNGSSGLRRWIQHNDVKVIFLERKNRLKKILSWEMAFKTKFFHSTKKRNKSKLRVDPAEIVEKINQDWVLENAIRRRLSQLSADIHYVEYEQLFSSSSVMEMHSILNFLEVESVYHETEDIYTKKVNSDQIEDIVENYEELKVSLHEASFQEFLD